MGPAFVACHGPALGKSIPPVNGPLIMAGKLKAHMVLAPTPSGALSGGSNAYEGLDEAAAGRLDETWAESRAAQTPI